MHEIATAAAELGLESPSQNSHGMRRRRPPAPIPRAKPLSRLGLVAALNRNPLTIWTIKHFEEPVLQGEGLLGYTTAISDPAGVRRVLVDNAANYRKDALQRRILAPGLGEGLLTAEGEAWRVTRRTLAPLFTPRQTSALAERMNAVIDRRIDRLAKKRPGSIVRLDQQMTTLTFEILAETLFSNAIPGGADAFGKAITLYFNTIGRLHPFDLLNLPSWIPRLGRGEAGPAIRFFSEQVTAIVAQRRALMAAPEAVVPPDLLTLLLEAADPETGRGLSEEEVAANIITFISAGHETTANALTWAIFLVQNDADVRGRLEAEVDAAFSSSPAAADVLDRLPFTRAVIEEALRLYPPVPTLSREAVEDDVVSGAHIPKGSLILISPYILHRHRRLWEAPDLFQPERFLPGAREQIDRFQFLPFGAGQRICIGAGFALQEAILALAGFTRRLRVRLLNDYEVEPLQRITLRPKGGLPMTLHPRN